MTTSVRLPSIDRRRALEAVLVGGFLAGVFDGLDAVFFFGWTVGVSPGRIFQHIASGLLGPSAFHYGWYTILLGIFLHFTIAFGAATAYYGASILLPPLLRKPFLYGPIFGLAVYGFMYYVVVPISLVATRTKAMSRLELINEVLVHALFVGLPIALVASRSIRVNARNEALGSKR